MSGDFNIKCPWCGYDVLRDGFLLSGRILHDGCMVELEQDMQERERANERRQTEEAEG